MRSRPLRALLALGLGLLGALAGTEAILRVAAGFAPRDRTGAGARANGPTIVCLGDSHTFGLGVAEGEAYPARLEVQLTERGVRVVNAGRPGSNSHVLLALAREWLASARPRVLVARVGVNDFWNAARPGDSFLESLRTVRLARLLLRRAGPAGSRAAPSDDRLPFAPIDAAFGRLSEVPRVYGGLVENLRRVVREARVAGAEPVLLAYSLDAHYYAVVNEALKQVAETEGALFADPSAQARRAAEADGYPSVFLPDFHPNARGYALEAAAVAAAIEHRIPGIPGEPHPADALTVPPLARAPDHELRDLEGALDVVEKEVLLLRRNLSNEALAVLRGHGRRILEGLSHPSLRRALPPDHPARRIVEAAARAFEEAAQRGDLEAAARAVASFPATIGAK